MGHNQVHDIGGNTAETDMEVDRESDLDGNEVGLLNDSDDGSDSGECDSDAEEAEDDEDLPVERIGIVQCNMKRTLWTG